MASWVHIANLALRKLGDDGISALDQADSEGARAVNDVHETVRDIVLRLHPWNCALERAILAPASPAPVWGFAYRYAFPTDPYCLRVWQLSPDHHARAPWKSLNREIHTDEGPALYVEYIKRVTDPEKFDANLVESIAAKIAFTIAWRITNSRTAESKMKDWFDSTLPATKNTDAQEGTPDDVAESEFLESRL